MKLAAKLIVGSDTFETVEGPVNAKRELISEVPSVSPPLRLLHPSPPSPFFEAIFVVYAESVRRCLIRHGVSEDDVDNTQRKVFREVKRRLPRYDGRARIARWLFDICMGIAANDLCDLYADSVRKFLIERGVREVDVDDEQQKVFQALYARLWTYNSCRARVTTWLYGISKNVARDYRRRIIACPLDTMDPEDWDVSEDSPDPYDIYIFRKGLLSILDGLTHNQRNVIECQIRGMTVPETAIELDRPEGTIWTWLREARKTIAAGIERLNVPYYDHAYARHRLFPEGTSKDLHGSRCPFGAHIRRSNPRNNRERRYTSRRGDTARKWMAAFNIVLGSVVRVVAIVLVRSCSKFVFVLKQATRSIREGWTPRDGTSILPDVPPESGANRKLAPDHSVDTVPTSASP